VQEKCRVCGAGTKDFQDPQSRLEYYYCETCEFIFKAECAIVSVEEEKAEYDLHNNSYEDEGYVNMFREFLKKSVLPFTPPGKRALDFGSGPEPVLAKVLAVEYGYEPDIYDLFYSPDKVYQGKKYDLITCTEVVEHLREPLKYFELFKELLKEDGIVAIMTHFHPRDQDKFLKWFYRREHTHISFFAPKTMEYMAQTVNLKMIYTDNNKYCTFSKSAF